jgi:hypothetical protein
VRFPIEIPKDEVVDLIRRHGTPDQAEEASQELPDPVDPEGDSGLLSKYGIDPQDLMRKLGGGGGIRGF